MSCAVCSTVFLNVSGTNSCLSRVSACVRRSYTCLQYNPLRFIIFTVIDLCVFSSFALLLFTICLKYDNSPVHFEIFQDNQCPLSLVLLVAYSILLPSCFNFGSLLQTYVCIYSCFPVLHSGRGSCSLPLCFLILSRISGFLSITLLRLLGRMVYRCILLLLELIV